MKLAYDKKEFYRAHLARDIRFDGRFFVAVKTTKIYCRPICPARKAHLKNLEFFIHAAQAEEAGYRPCLRCRPETAPGSAAWLGTSAWVQRAIRMMDHCIAEELNIRDLAKKLGIGERWLRELFQKQVGVNPQSILISRKLDIARNLLDHSTLSITEIAFSAGFQSIRRFNDAFKARFQHPPSAFRQRKKIVETQDVSRLQLSYRPPYAWDKLINFFKQRVMNSMELVEGQTYQRLITYGDIKGWFKAIPDQQNHKIIIEFKLTKNSNLIEFVSRIKNMFDLDADPMSIERVLKVDKKLKPYLKNNPGLRIPGGWDSFELAMRAIIGQRISVKAARAILNKIVEAFGELQTFDKLLPLKYFFPTPQQILDADLTKIGLPASKIITLKTLANEMVDGNLILDGTADYETTCKKLLAIKGIGSWTVEYIAMRTLKNPDAFPDSDLELQKQISRLKLQPEKWKPWRAYAAVLLWNL